MENGKGGVKKERRIRSGKAGVRHEAEAATLPQAHTFQAPLKRSGL